MNKYRKLDEDESLQVGDIVVSEHPIGGKYKRTITRLTAKLAIAKVRDDYDDYEVRYPIQYDMYFQQLPRQDFNQTSYTIYRMAE